MLHPSRILLAVALLTAAPAAAQNPLLQLRPAPDSVPKAAALPDRPETIAPIDIPLRAGLTIARLSEIEALVRPVREMTRSDRTRRLEIPVGVAYGTDPAAVITLLMEVAQGNERVRTHPKPLCLFQGFGESSLDFVLRVWTDADDFPVVRSEVRVAVYEALRASGIEIPFPQRDVHVRTLPSTPGAA